MTRVMGSPGAEGAVGDDAHVDAGQQLHEPLGQRRAQAREPARRAASGP